MRTTSKKMRHMPDVRKIVIDRLKALDLPNEEFAQRLQAKHGIARRSMLYWLAGQRENGIAVKGIRSDALGKILDELGLKIVPK